MQNAVQGLWIGHMAMGKKIVKMMVGNAYPSGIGASGFPKMDNGYFICVKEEVGTGHFAIRHQVAHVQQVSLAGTVSSVRRNCLVTNQHHVAH